MPRVTEHVFAAPLLQVEDVWEDLLVLKVSLASLTTHGRPTRWELWVATSGAGCEATAGPAPAPRFVTVSGRTMTLRVDDLPRGSSCAVRVRGVDADGNVGEWSALEQQLLPPVTLSQDEVEQDFLNLRWTFEDWSCPAADIVSRFELRLASSERDAGDTKLFRVGGSGDVHASHGTARIALPPSPFHNRAHYVQMRCWSERHQRWGVWSRQQRFFSLVPLQVALRCINEESATVVWGRHGGQRVEWPASRIAEEDVGVASFHIFAWPALRRRCSRAAAAARGDEGSSSAGPKECEELISIEAPQLHAQEENRTVMRGLAPQTVYNVKVRWLNRCGGSHHQRFFRFVTAPLPRLQQISAIGRTFVDVVWFLPRRVDAADLDEFVNDDRSAAYVPQMAVPGGQHCCDIAYTHVVDEASMQVTLMHAVRAERGGAAAAVKEVVHAADVHLQSTRLEGLQPGTPHVISVRTGGASFDDHAAGLGAERARWGRWSNSVVVTTVAEVVVRMEQRGHDFLDLSWSAAPTPPIAVIDPRAMRAVVLQDRGGGDKACELQLVDPHTRHVDPMRVIVGVEAHSPAPDRDTSAPAAALPGDGDPSWGTHEVAAGLASEHEAAALQLHEVHDGAGVFKFRQLQPSTSYRVSVNVCDSEGTWSGRRSIVAATLAPRVITAERIGGVRIDPSFHLEQQQLPPVGRGNDGRMQYEVVVDPDRQRQLKILATTTTARVGNVALLPEVEMLAHDHVILHWKGFTPGRRARASASSVVDSVVNIVLSEGGAATNVHGAPRAATQAAAAAAAAAAEGDDDVHENETAADMFNRAIELREYRVRLEWRPVSPDARHDCVPQTEELYFRSCTRRTRIAGLSCAFLYHAAMCLFDPDAGRWTPWSDAVHFAPIHTMNLFIRSASINGVVVQWAKRPLALQDVGNTAPTVVKRYEVTAENLTTGQRHVTSLSAPRASFTLTDMSHGLWRVVMRACYAYEAWAPETPPLFVAIAAAPLDVDWVGQHRIALRWPSLATGPFAKAWSRASASCLLLSVTREGASSCSVAELPFDATHHVVSRLASGSSYRVSALGIRQLLLPTATTTGDGDAAAAADATQPWAIPAFTAHAPLRVATLAATVATVEHVGEDFVSVRWPRVVQPRRVASTSTVTAGDGTTPGAAGAMVGRARGVVLTAASPPSELAIPSNAPVERYIVAIQDLQFGHFREESATCAASSRAPTLSKRITGLTGDSVYRVFVQPVLPDGTADARTEGVDVATLGQLEATLAPGPDPGVAEMRFMRHQRDAASGELRPAVFRNAIEVRVVEVPAVPRRKVAGLRALLQTQRRLYSRRATATSTAEVLRFTDLPPGSAKLCASFRQRSYDQVWSAWRSVNVVLPPTQSSPAAAAAAEQPPER